MKPESCVVSASEIPPQQLLRQCRIASCPDFVSRVSTKDSTEIGLPVGTVYVQSTIRVAADTDNSKREDPAQDLG